MTAPEDRTAAVAKTKAQKKRGLRAPASRGSIFAYFFKVISRHPLGRLPQVLRKAAVALFVDVGDLRPDEVAAMRVLLVEPDKADGDCFHLNGLLREVKDDVERALCPRDEPLVDGNRSDNNSQPLGADVTCFA